MKEASVKAGPDDVESLIRYDLIRDDPCLHVGREALKDSNPGALLSYSKPPGCCASTSNRRIIGTGKCFNYHAELNVRKASYFQALKLLESLQYLTLN